MHPLILTAFVLSGLSSLTLQTIWIRYLEHIFGATTLAVSTVLTCFMGGLALGSWIFGKYANKIKRPVVAYGIAEAVIGFSAFFIPPIIYNFYPYLNTWMTVHLENNFMLFSGVRFLAVAVLLLIPTTCMGATLPLLSRHYMRSSSQMNRVGERIGNLYTLNTLGALLGVFLATFVLLKSIGLGATNFTVGVVNVLLGVAILLLRNKLEKAVDDETQVTVEEAKLVIKNAPVAAIDSGKWGRFFAIFSFFLSGIASMNLQVVWNRAMALVIGSSVYSFALVLLAFLVGITAGSAVSSKISKRISNPVFYLGIIELLIATTALISYVYIDNLPAVFAKMVVTNISNYEDHVGLVQFVMFLVAAMAVLPVTFWMGTSFPLTIKAISRSVENVGSDVGNVYALNTVGAIIGSFLSAFVFVPVFSRYFNGFGMQISYFLSVSLYIFSAVMLLLFTPKINFNFRLIGAVAILLFSALYMGKVPAWDPAKLTIGVFRLSIMHDAFDEETWGQPDIKYYYDGVTTTVSVEMWGRHIAMKNNGKVEASNGDDMPTQIMVAAYPLLFHPQGPEDLDVAIVGFGSGVTVGSALEFPIKHVDCVELESAVVEASSIFGAQEGTSVNPEFNVNHLVYRDRDSPDYKWMDPNTYVINERLTIYANDGRNFLAARKNTYDVIISEPSNPWITGVANMFTRESFESSSKALKPEGIFAQWVQLYEMSPENIKTIFRTFAQVYPHVVLFSAEDLSSDTILLGSFSPIVFDLEKLNKIFKNQRVRQELNRAYVFGPTDVLARILLSSYDEVIDYTNGPLKESWDSLPINTDDNAYIEFAAPRDLISYKKFAGYLATIYTSQWEWGKLKGLVEGMGQGDKRAENLAQMAISLLMNGRKTEANRFAKEAIESNPENETAINANKMVSYLKGFITVKTTKPEEPDFSKILKEEEKNKLKNHLSRIEQFLNRNAEKLALGQFLNISDRLWKNAGPGMLHLKGYLHFINATQDNIECLDLIDVLTTLVMEHEEYVYKHPDIYYFLGMCHDNDRNFDKAVKNIRRYVELVLEDEALDEIKQLQQKANLEAALKGQTGTASIPLPSDSSQAPTTDAPGENEKEIL